MTGGFDEAAVKENLLKLRAVKEDFSVTFSGAKSKKYGSYRISDKKITLYTVNHANDAMLIYTAIHELAHHILVTEMGRGESGRWAHGRLFWGVFYDLADKAEELGIYVPEIDGELGGLIEEAKGISAEIARLQRELGGVMMRLQSACEAKGVDFEYAAERRAGISTRSVKAAYAAYSLGERGLGADQQAAAIAERSAEKRAALLGVLKKGKTVAQGKLAVCPVDTEGDEGARLAMEKRRIERTIAVLKRRLEIIIVKIDKIGGERRRL